MLNTLYEKFRSWSDGGSVWIYSDTHFEDNDCKLMDPDWITPKEQITRINKFVRKQDTFILLGDVGNKKWVEKIRANRKILILGNHDEGADKYRRDIVWTPTVVERKMGDEVYYVDINVPKDNLLFDEVYTGPLMISEKIILSHEPIPNITWALNIHGHDHSGGPYDLYHWNVCSNTCNYEPINLKDIINSGALKKIDSLHRQTIDRASKK